MSRLIGELALIVIVIGIGNISRNITMRDNTAQLKRIADALEARNERKKQEG